MQYFQWRRCAFFARCGVRRFAAQRNAICVDQLAIAVDELQGQDLSLLNGVSGLNRQRAGRTSGHIGLDLAALPTDRPADLQFREIAEVVLVLDGHPDRPSRRREGNGLFFDLDRRMELLRDPELGFLSPPAIHHTPRRIANQTPVRHLVGVLDEMASRHKTPVLESSARHAEQVVAPTPDEGPLRDLVLCQEFLYPALDVGLDVVVAHARVDPQLGDVVENALENAMTFVEEHRTIESLDALHPRDCDRIVQRGQFERGGGGRAARPARIGLPDPLVTALEPVTELAFVAYRPVCD